MVLFLARALQTEVEVKTVCSRKSKEVCVTGEELEVEKDGNSAPEVPRY